MTNQDASAAEIGAPEAERSVLEAVLRGLRLKCPACGVGRVFASYLKVAPSCATCGEELHHHRADDAPPWATIFIAGHLIVAGVLITEKVFSPPSWVQVAVWVPLSMLAVLALLPTIKGAVVGLQWANRMHGFAGPTGEIEPADGYRPNEELTTGRPPAHRPHGQA